ncbi:MAG: DUF6134 family protein [Pseudomonadota bacterium]
MVLPIHARERPVQSPTRRGVLGLIGLAAGIGMVRTNVLAQGSLPRDLAFKVARNGSQVGLYKVQFQPTDSGFSVSASVDIAIKIAFMTVYRYAQSSDCVWQRGAMVRSEIRTDDNGKVSDVSIEAGNKSLMVEGPSGLVEAPLDTLTDGSLWNIAITRRQQVIDGERGDLMRIGGTGPFEETLDLDGKEIPTQRFTFASDREHSLAGTLWYDTTNTLARIDLETRGERFEYQPIA